MSVIVSHVPAFAFGQFLTDSATLDEIAVAPYRNTKEIILYNPSEDFRFLFRMMDPAELTGVPANDVAVGNAIIVPVLGSVSLAIGPEGEREPFELTTSLAYTAQMSIYMRTEDPVGPHGISIIYVQCRGDL